MKKELETGAPARGSAAAAPSRIAAPGARAFVPVDTLVPERGRFRSLLAEHHGEKLSRGRVTTLQVNVGKLCNQACHHCHVEAGPKRTEIMEARTADRVLELLEASPGIEVVDITGGAPELNPQFRKLVRGARALDKKIIDRSNLTVFFEPGTEWLPRFLTENRVEIIASLPCYLPENVERQRGAGVFEPSIRALRLLNGLGYANGADPPLELHLVYNPLGAYLPPPQAELEGAYRRELREKHGVRFNRLFTITNMPIKRFAEQLLREGKMEAYLSLLVRHFNPATVPELMCRSMVSVGWDGKLYDCDFNQMLELTVENPGPPGHIVAPDIWDLDDFACLEGQGVRTADHCLGCTAGAGSSCGGELV